MSSDIPSGDSTKPASPTGVPHPALHGPMPPRRRFLLWALLWALAIAYGSVIVGPTGLNFVPLRPSDAWQLFLQTPYVLFGSDQRPDWIANLLFVVPLGFLVSGALWPQRRTWLRWVSAVLAFASCLTFVFAVKYAQLYFPPRTVTLNYIFAQSAGSILGIALFAIFQRRRLDLLRSLGEGGSHTLTIVLLVYTGLLLLFYLFPFDFILSAADFRTRLLTLPQSLLAWPGEGRPFSLRVILLLSDIAATAPLGVLLTIQTPRPSLLRIAFFGLAIMVSVGSASTLVLSSAPSLISIFYRTLGVAAGAIGWRQWESRYVPGWTRALTRIAPVLAVLYVLAVLFVNELVRTRWHTVDEALVDFDWRVLLPFWNYYIVPKAHAAASLVVQSVMFGPIGVLVFMRFGSKAGSGVLAAALAFAFSLAVEGGRWLGPELRPDISDAFVAALAAWVSVRTTPFILRTIDAGLRASRQETEPGVFPGATAVAPRSSRLVKQRTNAVYANRAAWIIAASCAALDGAIIVHYPLVPWAMGVLLLLYAFALWRWPATWLLVLPTVLPAFDLRPWTGWQFVGEADLFVVTTVAVLAVRTPLRRQDIVMTNVAGAVIAGYVAVYLVAIVIGLALPGPAGGSDNPYLRPDNALRLAKGLGAALFMLPFLQQRQRVNGDAAAKFAVGMVTGLLAVTVTAIIERALFPGILDFKTDYRIVASFAGMHLGGGLIGAYLAMTLPYVAVFLLRPRWYKAVAMLIIVVLAGYVLVVTYARTAYAAALVGMVAATGGWMMVPDLSRRNAVATFVLPAIALAAVCGIVALGAFDTQYMFARLETIAPDLGTRENNWTGGLALRDAKIKTDLFGTGLGTYPRIVLANREGARAPVNFTIKREDGKRFLSVTAESMLYFVQRVAIDPDQTYKLTVTLRSPDGKGAFSAMLCENVLLYSENCRGPESRALDGHGWQNVSVDISAVGLEARTILGWFKRPVVFTMFDPVRSSALDISDVRLMDPSGRNIIANGDFAGGMERWYFSSDDHLVWRIHNQYLMTLFESGVVGLGALLLLLVAALSGAVRAVRQGHRMAAAVLGSLGAFLVSGLFDYLLEDPRLATLFYLVCFLALSGFGSADLSFASLSGYRAREG